LHHADVVGSLEQVKATQHKETPMPRFNNSGRDVSRWAEGRQEPSHSLDVCQACVRSIEEREMQYPSWVALDNDEPKGTLERADWHPDYTDTDYRCDFCSAELGEDDNDPDAADPGDWT
tara:strand:+ start:1699 stop:2055 length:357 start_codon:yes stop_codon:yes gene_type:complete